MTFSGDEKNLSTREKEVLDIYTKLNKANQHKMHAIPVCAIPKNLR
jgi:NAD+ synthase